MFLCGDVSLKRRCGFSASLLLSLCVFLPMVVLFFLETATGCPKRPAMIVGAFLTAIGVSEGITQILKTIVQRRRPNFYALCGFDITQQICKAQPQRIIEAQLSFPSGHSSLSMCAAVFMWRFCMFKICQTRRWQPSNQSSLIVRYDNWIKAGVTIVSIGSSIAIGVSRLVDHWHHPSDVLAGWMLGGIVASCIYRSQGLYG